VTGTVDLAGVLTSKGISARGSFLEDPPDHCQGPVAVLGGTPGNIGSASSSSDVVTSNEQRRTNIQNVQTIARVVQGRLGGLRAAYRPAGGGGRGPRTRRPAGQPRGGAGPAPKQKTSSYDLSPLQGGMRFDANVGLPAGEGGTWLDGPIATWLTASYGSSSDDTAATAFDATRFSFLAGADVSLRDDLVVGVALGVDRSDIDTAFNGGNAEVTGLTIAPYAGLLLTDALSVDAAIGYSLTTTDQFRTATGTSTRITSGPEGERWFASANAAYRRAFGSWSVTGTLGWLYARNLTRAFIESNGGRVEANSSRLGQFRAGAELAYEWPAAGGYWEPYGGLTLEHDFTTTALQTASGTLSTDDTGGQLRLGLRYFGDNDVSGLLEYSSIVGRQNFGDSSLTATVRWNW